MAAIRKDVKMFIEKRLKQMKEEEEEEKEKKQTEQEQEEDEEEEEDTTNNKFANDGSFLELFKKKMAEQEGAQSSKDSSLLPKTEKEDGGTQLKAYQAGVGQRKSLLKTMKLREQRKRRREEIEELQRREEEEASGQSVAWRTYMREVKELEEKCCSEKEDHKRPLVK